MKGNNIIHLNPASINEALAEYLNKRFSLSGKTIEVTDVVGPTNSYAPEQNFKVNFTILEEPLVRFRDKGEITEVSFCDERPFNEKHR